MRLANLSHYRGVLSVSARVRLLGECTVARVHEILQETNFDLTQGGDSVQPTNVRSSPLVFEKILCPRDLASTTILHRITDFPIIANINVVQQEIAKTMHRLATQGHAGEQKRRSANWRRQALVYCVL